MIITFKKSSKSCLGSRLTNKPVLELDTPRVIVNNRKGDTHSSRCLFTRFITRVKKPLQQKSFVMLARRLCASLASAAMHCRVAPPPPSISLKSGELPSDGSPCISPNSLYSFCCSVKSGNGQLQSWHRLKHFCQPCLLLALLMDFHLYSCIICIDFYLLGNQHFWEGKAHQWSLYCTHNTLPGCGSFHWVSIPQ